MQLKDYYKTLRVPPTATLPQIKKSYRQLALMYHPDKNPGNAVAEATFKEIQEAYETLIDPGKREEYNYKRWYSRSIKDIFVNEPLTPAAILNRCIRLKNYMQTVNTLRVDVDGLSHHIRQILNDQNMDILQQFNDENINARLVEAILRPASVLPFDYIAPIASRLLRVAGNNDALAAQVQNFVSSQKQKNNWQKYGAVFVIVITIILCLAIYMIGR
ncbi:MAG: hypothetical protein NVSMB7_10170 [Chitinophagaceae bacterium]